MSNFDRKYWGFGDLTDKERELAENEGCQAGRKYFGVPGDACDVPVCPFCGEVSWEEQRCPHFAFDYDWTNGQYREIASQFEDWFWSRWILVQEQKNNAWAEDLAEAKSDKVLPTPESLSDMLNFLQLWEDYTIDGTGGMQFGFVDLKIFED